MAITFTLELPDAAADEDITRADLTFSGLDHSGPSYEVRVYFNHADAGADTPLTAHAGYVGRFALFGHGGCFGDDGHCEVVPPVNEFDRSHPHQLTPATRILSVTDPVKALVAGGAASVQITAVAVVRPSALASAAQADTVLVIDQVALHLFA